MQRENDHGHRDTTSLTSFLTDGGSGGNPNDRCGKLQTMLDVAQVGCRLGHTCLLVIEYIAYFGHLHNLVEL